MKKVIVFLLKVAFLIALIIGVLYYSFNMIMSAFVHEKAEILVPDLQGKTLMDSLDILSGVKLALMKEGSEFNQDVPAGTVIRQVPPPGMNVKEGKTVRLVISQGGEIVYIPDLTGQTLRSADISLRAAGLMLGEVSRKFSVNFAEGEVISQEPLSGATVDKDAVVNIVVSQGKPEDDTKLMPDWIGKSASDAKEWAVDEDYDVEVISENTMEANPGEVFKQNPDPDDKLSRTSKIFFYMADKKSVMKKAEQLFNYTVPSEGGSKRVRLILVDSDGEKDIFNGVKKPGATISIPVKAKGKAMVRVFINNVSIEDIELK